MEIRTLDVISTSHVSKETADWLNEQGEIAAAYYQDRIEPSIHIGATIYGWVIYADEEPENLRRHIPDDLIDVMKFVRAEGHEYVMLDRDGEVAEGLPTFDW